ncbi:MAG: hypothetical protein QE271_01780 [Bacteriovoracaceae bacterium]|nr:hypothetical protein [Bacteriovoracaceae bacterium]
MNALIWGTIASLLSAVTALIVASSSANGVNPLWLLGAQYLVGIIFCPPKQYPVAPIKIHALRLVSGLWAFGAYYFALSFPDTGPKEASMILNTAPVFATFYAVPEFRTRLGAIFASAGVVLSLASSNTALSFHFSYVLALTAAFAYAASFYYFGKTFCLRRKSKYDKLTL